MSLVERIVAKVLKIGNRRYSDANTTIEFDVGLSNDNPAITVLAGQDYLRTNVNFFHEQSVEVLGNLTTDGTVDVGGTLDVTGSAIFRGSLEVQGTQTFLNSNDLLVEDKSIQINYGSTTLNAEGAGLDVLGSANASLARIIYSSTDPSRFKAGPTGSEKVLLVSGEVVNADISASAAIAGSKVVPGTASTYGTVKGGQLPSSGTGFIGDVVETLANLSSPGTQTAGTAVDVTNSTLPLTGGRWLASYDVTHQTGTGATAGNRTIAAQVQIVRASDNVPTKGGRAVFLNPSVPASTSWIGMLSASTIIDVPAGSTVNYKLQVVCNLNNGGTGGSTSILSGGVTGGTASDSYFKAVKIQ